MHKCYSIINHKTNTIKIMDLQHQTAGRLIVKVIEARLTHNTEIINKMDPYVFIKHRGQESRTSVRKKAGKHPIWN